MSKRGQVTLFIIVGIFILVFIGIIIYLKSPIREGTIKEIKEASSELQPIINYIDSCTLEIAKEGLYLIGQQGGYYTTKEPYLDYSSILIPYYFYLREEHIPTLDSISDELSVYIKDNLLNCVDFAVFEGYKIEQGKISVDTDIVPGEIVFALTYPLSIEKGSFSSELDKFRTKLNFDFYSIYDIISNVTEKQKEDPDSILVGDIADLAYENDFIFNIINLEDNEVLHTFRFENALEPDKPYFYAFVNKYNWSEYLVEEVIYIETIGDKIAYTGYEFSYHVKAIGENVRFMDYTDLFNIDEISGLIKFVPKIEDRGKYTIMIKVYDDKGNEDVELFNLKIIHANKPPIIEEIDDVSLGVGEEFNLKINAIDPDGDNIFYLVETSLENFNLDIATGEISFIPTIEQKGSYTITVIVTDSKSESTKEYFDMVIE